MSRDQSALSRTMKVASMTAGIGGSYVGYLIQRAFLGDDQRDRTLRATHKKAGQRMSKGMGELRGPIMKLGQLLSLQTDLLAPETLAELTNLQMEAPPMHPSLARAQFRAALGVKPEDVFANFDDVAFAAASLGQVHRAVTHEGTTVAVKIQYPGIAEAVSSDFRMLRAASLPARIARIMPTSVIEELEAQIVAEADYAREARNIALFREQLRPLPFVDVPEVLTQFSAARVLTMSLLRGDHLDTFLEGKPSQRLRDLVGTRLFELHYFQLLRMGAFQADPNWGNYLFRADGTVGLVDFGCVKYVPEPFVRNLKEIFLYQGSKRDRKFRAILDRRYELHGVKLTSRARAALTQFSEKFYERVYPPNPSSDDRPFDFRETAFLREYLREAANLAKARGALPEYVFLVRAETGLYQTLHRLGARVRTSHVVRQYIRD